MGYDHDTITPLNDLSSCEKAVKQIEIRDELQSLRSHISYLEAENTKLRAADCVPKLLNENDELTKQVKMEVHEKFLLDGKNQQLTIEVDKLKNHLSSERVRIVIFQTHFMNCEDCWHCLIECLGEKEAASLMAINV